VILKNNKRYSFQQQPKISKILAAVKWVKQQPERASVTDQQSYELHDIMRQRNALSKRQKVGPNDASRLPGQRFNQIQPTSPVNIDQSSANDQVPNERCSRRDSQIDQ